jgi:predicted phosphoribosyltransferase
MGVVNILKTLAQSTGPSITGILAGRNHFWVAFVVAGSLKAAYDLMLLAFFGGKVHPRKGISEVADGNTGGVIEDQVAGDVLDSSEVSPHAEQDGPSSPRDAGRPSRS